MQTLKNSVKSFLPVFVILAYTSRLGQAQVDTMVQIPTALQKEAVSSSQPDLTLAGEYKQTKNVIEQEKPVFWNWAADIGYVSEYNFRGTNLMPDADGGMFLDLEVSKWGFTLGVYDIYQLGTAHAPSLGRCRASSKQTF